MEVWYILVVALALGMLAYITLSIGSMAKDLYVIRKILEKIEKGE